MIFVLLFLCFSSFAQAVEPQDIENMVEYLTPTTFQDWKAKASGGDPLAPVIVGLAYSEGKGIT